MLSGLMAGCASSGSLGAAADRLDASAHRFSRQLHDSRAPSHTVTDAAQLADAARQFNREVDRSRSRDLLRASFDDVAERYHHLRQRLDDGGYYARYYDRYGFDRVTEAYLDVDRAMNHPRSRYEF
ncbi:MAG TPA: hypothetical protein VFR29_10245 [Steroidobacteraceae bacterium]|nr:hypothetical protein [Steroidobacteraceae bacterium]